MKQLPNKTNIEAQETFHMQTLTPLIEQAHQGKIHLLFVDAAHFVLLPFLGYLYSLVARYIKSTPGRQRFNVLGALHAITLELVTVCNASKVSSEEMVQLLDRLKSRYVDAPIVLVLDNARYQHCALVCETAEQLGITLAFLPPYAPNLNLIERVWKFVKKKTLYNHYYPTFQEFTKAITNCLADANTTHWSEFKSLLTLNFHIPKKEYFAA